ncbi:MAG: hypothetical protein Q8P31_05515 [Bacillota bacterium]|nr:hypothetical protein [Bacillota bacterium]
MSNDPLPRTGLVGRMLAGLKRLLVESPGRGDLPDVRVNATENPGNLSAFRGPGGGTLTGLGPGEWVADGASRSDVPPSVPADRTKPGPDRQRRS